MYTGKGSVMTCQIVMQHAILGLTLTINTWIGSMDPDSITRMIIDSTSDFVAVSRRCDEVVDSEKDEQA